MTQEEALRKGIVAATLLDNEDVVSFLDEYVQDIRTSLFATEPADESTRQTLYYDHRAVEGFISRLKAYRAAAQQIIEQAEKASKEIDH